MLLLRCCEWILVCCYAVASVLGVSRALISSCQGFVSGCLSAHQKSPHQSLYDSLLSMVQDPPSMQALSMYFTFHSFHHTATKSQILIYQFDLLFILLKNTLPMNGQQEY